jgi:hypothetical protein
MSRRETADYVLIYRNTKLAEAHLAARLERRW